LEIHRRLEASKDRGERYQLAQFVEQYPGKNNNNSFNNFVGSPAQYQQQFPPFSPHQQSFLPPITNNQQFTTFEQQEKLIKSLQEDLKSAEEDMEDLEMEIIQVMKEKDQTPPAILFFSVMNDPSFIPNLQQLILQFQSIKQFLDYSANMDYLTLRKRLQVCMVIMPSIDKLIEKYSHLFSKWSNFRLNWFAERKVRGSASDGMNYCPLCYHDITEVKDEEENNEAADHPHHNQGRRGGGRGKSEKKREDRTHHQDLFIHNHANQRTLLPAAVPAVELSSNSRKQLKLKGGGALSQSTPMLEKHKY
jgi:uncharacterized Zn finger protein (UPF0148 family)